METRTCVCFRSLGTVTKKIHLLKHLYTHSLFESIIYNRRGKYTKSQATIYIPSDIHYTYRNI